MKRSLNEEFEARLEEMRLIGICDAFGDAGDEVAALISDLGLTTQKEPEVFKDFERCSVTPFEAEIILGNLSYTPSIF